MWLLQPSSLRVESRKMEKLGLIFWLCVEAMERKGIRYSLQSKPSTQSNGSPWLWPSCAFTILCWASDGVSAFHRQQNMLNNYIVVESFRVIFGVFRTTWIRLENLYVSTFVTRTWPENYLGSNTDFLSRVRIESSCQVIFWHPYIYIPQKNYFINLEFNIYLPPEMLVWKYNSYSFHRVNHHHTGIAMHYSFFSRKSYI